MAAIKNLIVVVLVVLVCSMDRVWSQDTTTESTDTTTNTIIDDETTTTKPKFTTCAVYEGTPLNLEPMQGDWFETARNSDVDSNMQCMNITVPAAVNENNKLVLDIKYVDTTDNKWEQAHSSGSFSWDENTQNGIFHWNIGDVSKVNVTYKLVDTDETTYAFFCGWIGTAPVPLFKVWTRSRHLTNEEKEEISLKFGITGQATKIVWVEQSVDKCNSAMRSAGGALVALAFALLIYRRNI